MDQNREEQIRQRAHRLWEKEGKPEGREAEHWQKAAKDLDVQDGSGREEEQRQPLSEASKSSRAAQERQSDGAKKPR